MHAQKRHIYQRGRSDATHSLYYERTIFVRKTQCISFPAIFYNMHNSSRNEF